MPAEFFGNKIRERVGVVFLAAEGAGTLPHRIEAAKRAAGVQGRLPIATISVVSNLSDEAAILTLIPTLRLIDAEFRSKFGVRLGLVIIDTVAAAFVMANENSNAEAAQILRRLRELASATGGLIMPVHHYGKTDGSGLRGASAFQAGADAIISVTADRDGNSGNVKNRAISLIKSRTGSEGPISGFDVLHMTLGLDEDGDAFGAGYVAGNDSPVTRATAQRGKQSTIIFRAAFDAAHGAAGAANPGSVAPDAQQAVLYDAVQGEYVRRYTLPGSGRSQATPAAQKAFTRCVAALPAEFSDITDADGFRWICRQS